MNTQRVEGHTPTPWMYSKVETSVGYMFKVGTPEMVVGSHGAVCLYDDRSDLNPHANGVQEANAAFIVHAVNNIERLEKVNEALVEALELLIPWHISMVDGLDRKERDEFQDAIIKARESLALAKEPA